MKHLLVVILFYAFTFPAIGCTTFCFDGIFGRNYDFMIGNGLVIVNKRDVAKTSLSEMPAHWKSKYGSVTFNQFGREFPTGGMNEAGLVVELMWLEVTRYPERDKRPELGGLEWIQYQLDNFDSVDALLAALNSTRITSVAPLHYLIADKSGNVASIEFLDGKAVVHTGNALPIPVLTNDTYEKSVRFVKDGKHRGDNSLKRFAIAAEMVKAKDSKVSPIDYAFSILDSVAQRGSTQWSIVYDMKRHKVFYRTAQNRAIRSFDFSSFNFACGSEVKILNVNQVGSGDVANEFTPYKSEVNRDLISYSYSRVPFLGETPADAIPQAVSHSENMKCVPQAAGER
jgi:choloylglycine hydrolase